MGLNQNKSENVDHLLADTFQIAYVTEDLNAAVNALRAQRGIKDFLEIGPTEADLGGGLVGNLRVALAYMGNVQYEVIEPISENLVVYREALHRLKSVLVFHHVSYFAPGRNELEELRKHMLGGKAAPIYGEFGSNSAFFYVDERPRLGHFVEYQYTEPEFDTLVPRNI